MSDEALPPDIRARLQAVMSNWHEPSPGEQLDRLNHVIDDLIDACTRYEARIETLEHAIKRVLADDESSAGGWGPDVTMVAVLRDALDAK